MQHKQVDLAKKTQPQMWTRERAKTDLTRLSLLLSYSDEVGF